VTVSDGALVLKGWDKEENGALKGFPFFSKGKGGEGGAFAPLFLSFFF
jgi:hypothetical protein